MTNADSLTANKEPPSPQPSSLHVLGAQLLVTLSIGRKILYENTL